MNWLLLIGVSWAGTSLVRPSPSAPLANECSRSIAIAYGKPLPSELVVDGVAVCDAVAEPTSSLNHLLAVENYSIAADRVHQIDLNQLRTEIDGWRAPILWHQQPRVQRWIGRIEVLCLVGVVAGTVAVAYNQTARAE